VSELAAIVVGLIFATVTLVVTVAAREIRRAQDRHRLHREQLQLEAAIVELHELHETQRAAELWRWNNPDRWECEVWRPGRPRP
jgi:hypothetical protein